MMAMAGLHCSSKEQLTKRSECQSSGFLLLTQGVAQSTAFCPIACVHSQWQAGRGVKRASRCGSESSSEWNGSSEELKGYKHDRHKGVTELTLVEGRLPQNPRTSDRSSMCTQKLEVIRGRGALKSPKLKPFTVRMEAEV